MNIIGDQRVYLKKITYFLFLAIMILPGCGNSSNEGEFTPPNIIFILTDDQRWDAIGCAGNDIIQTPAMDQLAKEGFRFEQAFVTTPICAASRASLFTGLYERTHGYTFTKPPVSHKFTSISYPFMLRKAGYRTGFIGKFGIKVEEGVMDNMFDTIMLGRFPYFQEVSGEMRHLTDIRGDQAVEFLKDCSPEEPFCLSLWFNAPHAHDGREEQYFWPASCDELYDDIEIPIPETADPAFFDALPEFLQTTMNRERWYWRYDTPEKYQGMVKGYYRMISGIDNVLARIRTELKSLGMDENTIIILMGDNGYYIGDRGYAGKWLMHEQSLRVPLILYDPRKPEKDCGRVLTQTALNIDISPTILDLAGLPVPGQIQGESLLPLINGQQTDWRSFIFCEHLWDHPQIPQSECIRDENWKYIRYQQHPEFIELYNLKKDPHEKINLADLAEYSDLIKGYSLKCDSIIRTLYLEN